MMADLNRDEFIQLLEKLGDEGDENVLSAARDIHAWITVSGMGWDDLLVPEQGEEEEVEEVPEPREDEDLGEDNDEEENLDEDLGEDLGEDLDEDLDDEPDDESEEDAGPTQLTSEERDEAEALIAQIMKKSSSASTKKELEGYQEDLDEDEFEMSDLKYLRALNQRLTGSS